MNYDDIRKRYGLGSSDDESDAREENSTQTSTSPYDSIRKRYGITSPRIPNQGNTSDKKEEEDKTPTFDYETGKKGWEQYLADQSSAKQQETEEESFWDKLGRWLGPTGATDTTLPMGNTAQIVHDVRNDTSYTKPSDDWSDEQRYEFGALYLESPEKAYAYAEKTNNANNKAKEEAEIKKVQDSATSNGWAGAAHTAGAIASAGLGMADYLNMLVMSNAGRDPLQSDGIVSPFEYSTAVTEGIGTHLNETYGTLDEDIPIFGGKGWGDVYGLGTSIAQSAASGYALGPAGTLVSYFGQGAASGMKDALERGASEWQAARYGAALGAFEGVAESIGIDNLFKLGSSSTIKGLLKNILQQAKAEGLEEGLTSVLSNIADVWVMKDKSNFNTMLNAYMEAGMSEKDAKWAVFWDSLEGIAFDMIAGAASGGIHGGLQTGIQTGKYSSYVKNAFGGQVEDLLIEAGQAATDETGDAVDKYINKYGEKGKLSGMNIAHLLEITDTAKVKSAAETRLTQLGEKGNISQLADILTKQVQGMELSKSEQKLLDESTYGQRVANELNPENIRSGEYATNWSEQIGTRTINPKEYNKGKNVVAEDFPNKIVTKGVPEEGIATEAELEASEEGDATLDDTISIMNNMVEKMELSDDVAGQMLEHFKTSDVQQAKLYQHAVPLAYNYGKIGYSAGLQYITSLSEQDRNYAYRRGAIDALLEADTKQSQIESSKTGSTQGATKKKGIIYEGGYKYKEATATPLQKSSMKAIEVINAISNLEIHVFESVEENGKRVYNLNGEKVNAPNGYFKDGNKIYIDINAGQHGEGLMLDTLGHEVTHYIRENDAKGFKAIADFLIEQYGKKGVNVEALLESQRKKIRNRYAREGAVLPSDAKLNDMAYEELVADAMSEMLSDPKAYDKLAKLKQQNRSAWETLRDAIKNILDKIKSILDQYKSEKRKVAKDAATPEANAVRDFSADAYEKLQDLYIKAFVEADANYAVAERTLSDNGIMVDPSTESATIYSVRDVLDDDQRQNVAKALATRFNVTQKEALQWLTAETSLASLILNPKYSQYLDYVPDPNEVAIKTNSDYPQGTVDFSPICAKRREFTAVMNNILRLFKNHVFAATDLAKIRSIMQEEGMTIPCGICYVEDRRQLDTIVAQNFIDSLKLYREGSKTRPDGKAFNTNQLKGLKLTDGDSYTPTVYELVSLEGLNVLKEKNPSMAEAWIKFNNARGMQSVRLLANEAEYKRQILKYGKQTVKAKNDKGGLRIYSFSDAEMFHLIDIIQVITDSATVGLSLQGYTKVNEYAKAVKDTGEKLNRSLIPKGELGYHIENGEVILDYDTVEGIDINHPDFFDNRDNPNVGNITIGVSDTQIRAAMVSDFVDQIIPFHTGQSEDVLGEKGIATWSNYKDFQTEKDIATGKVSDHQINIYTEVLQPLEKEGNPITKRTFVEKFLQVCKENNLTPRFSQFLNTNENGDFIYNEGYHKMLVDFKTFAQTETGEYLPQLPVKPIFDNEYITKILKDYVKSQEIKDAELAKSMPKVIERITNEIVKPSETKLSDRDSEGNKLSAEQIEFFKDSKVRDAEGRLVSQYHGTPNGGFTEFKLPHYLHSLTSANGAGFYFTDERNARQYMKGLNGKSVTKKKLYNVYLNITNPLEITEYSTGAISDEVFRRIMARGNYEWGMAHTDVEKLLQFNKYDTDRLAEMVKVFNGDEILTVMKEELGYDGVRYTDRYGDVWVAWDNRQIKETTNKTPTSDPDIRYSDREIQPITEEEYQTLEKHFGVTGNFRVAGYLLPNGKLLDFSGKHWGDTTSRSRQVDHRDVNEVLDRGNNGYSSMVDMIGSGNIRLMPETGGINLAVYPNEKQRRVLSAYINYMLATEGQVIVDYDAVGGDTVYSRVYEKGVTSSRILSDIRNYFNGGRQSDLMQFHTMYSDRDTETISNRTLLANALDSVAKNDIEKNRLNQYKNKIALIESEQAKLTEIRAELRELYFTKGRRDTDKIKSLQTTATQIENRINTYDRQLLKLESTEALKGVLDREKKMAYKKAEQRGKESLRRQKEKDAATVRELMTRNYESRKKATESRNKTAMREKIRKVVNDLNKLLLNPTQDKHVPIGLQKVVAEALDVINMDTMNAEERVAYYNDLISKSNNPDEIAMLKKKRDFFEYRDMNFKDRITSLKSAYAEFKESDDSLIRNAHNDAIEDLIKNTADEVGNKSLKDMSLTQLEKVYDMYKAILATVRNTNKMFKEGRQETVTENSNAVKLEVREVGGHKDRVLKMTKFLKKFGWEMLKPVTAMKVIGSKTFERLFNNVRAAEDTWAVDVNEAKQFYEDIAAKYGYNKWDLKKFYSLKDGAGADISMTLEQIMSLYAYSKREQADQHLEFGGFIFDDAIEVVEKNKILGIPLKYEVNDANPHRLRKEHILDIISVLTKEQKDFVDAMQTYLSDVMGAKGNEVSLAMYDIKLYKEKNYFPLKTSRYFREFDPEKSGTPKIKNSGFSKKTVPQAGNPIVLSNFMDVWAGHVNDMSMYHAFVLPLEDFMRVYNYSLTAGGYDSVQQYIKNAYGSQANQYIERLLDDLNGGARVDSSAGIANKLISLHKKASVVASASVVVQQPSAIARALAYIHPKYFAKATPEALNIAKHKTLWAEVKKYAPVAIIKEMGYFDTGVGRGTVEWIKGNQTFMDKMDDVLSKAPAIADELCWTHIWEAVKKENKAKSKSKVGSEIFLMECGKRFTEVITNTQVYDSVLSRSGYMRSKDTAVKMATAFMAEPTTTVNMMVDGIIQGMRGNKKFTASTVGAISASIILNSILVSLVYAARDDDEDETYLEKYIGSLTSELLEGFNPLTYLPYIKDGWSLLQGYDVERSDMAVLSDLVDTINRLFNENISGWDKVLDVTGSVSSLFGIPLKNIIRDAKGMYNLTNTILSGTPTTGAGIKDAIEDSFKSSIPLWDILHESDSKADRLYKAIMSGDQDHIDRVKATYKSEQAYETALKSALRENDSRIHEAAQARLDGNISEYTRIAREIIAEGHFSQDTVVAAINSEMSAIKKGESTQTESTDSKDEVTSIYRADDINVAFDNGDTSLALSIIDELVEMKMANGMDEKKAKSSLRSSMTSYWKPLYKQAYASGNTAEMQRIKQILYKSGLYGSATEVIKDVNSWLKN